MSKITDERDNLLMIQTPQEWPQWPWLPIKKWSDTRREMDCAVINAGNLTTIWHTNLWALSRRTTFEDVSKTQFDSAEAIVAAGWVVD